MDSNRFFNVVVAGNNHKELMDKYDGSKPVEPYVAYKFSEIDKHRKMKERVLEAELSHIKDKESYEYEYLSSELEDIRKMDDIDFFLYISDGCDIDEETGDAISNKNLEERFDFCNIANRFAKPFILKDGTESYSAKKKDIDWSKVHLCDAEAYEVAWDTVMEGKKPKTDEERNIYNNMKERTHYFSLFGDRENYIKANTAFWGYAFVSEKTGWVELDNKTPQFKWVTDYYDKFIKPLPENTLLTIYECYRS
jgi:hypothetical protein